MDAPARTAERRMSMVKDCHNCEHHTWGDEWWNCKTECTKCKYTDMQGEKVPSNWKPMPITNADRIRAMSDEELAVFMKTKGACPNETKHRGCVLSCGECWLEWLQQPAEGE